MNRHTEYTYSNEIKRRLFTTKVERRIESACSLLLAIAIGTGLAVLLVAWWSS